MTLICIAPDATAKLWHVVEPMIAAAYKEVDDFIPVDLPDSLIEGKRQLWVFAPDGSIVAALITTLQRRPSGLVCQLMVCGGGEMASWLNGGHAQIEAYAKAERCCKVVAEGRPGWSRVLPGYEARRIVLEKRL